MGKQKHYIDFYKTLPAGTTVAKSCSTEIQKRIAPSSWNTVVNEYIKINDFRHEGRREKSIKQISVEDECRTGHSYLFVLRKGGGGE